MKLDNAGPCRNAIVTILHSYEISTPKTYTLATNSLANYDLICAVRYVNETYLRGTKKLFQQTMKRENEISNNTDPASQGRKPKPDNIGEETSKVKTAPWTWKTKDN